MNKELDSIKSTAIYKLLTLLNRYNDPELGAILLYIAVVSADNPQHAKVLLNRANTLAASGKKNV